MGNLNHFLGSTFGKTDFVRDRDAEFSTKKLTKLQLVQLLVEANLQVTNTFFNLNESDMQNNYPFDFAGKHSTEFYLIFFISHFEYHLGQINYYRRISEN
ncbi:MAG: DUF1572 family protein [Bacteroidia bacterium]|nr:DUF1572 family protein [Bacteroidia bacterium]